MRYASLGLWALLALGVSALSVQAAETSQNNAQNTTVATPAPADNSAVQSQDSVVVFGESETANGQQDEFLMEQSSSNENPLGNPIVDSAASAPTPSVGEMPNNAMNDASASQSTPDVKVAPSNVVQDNEAQNPSVSQEPDPAALNNQIENTLYQSDGRIYDVQSYPDTDVERIEALPQPTITDYPSY